MLEKRKVINQVACYMQINEGKNQVKEKIIRKYSYILSLSLILLINQAVVFKIFIRN